MHAQADLLQAIVTFAGKVVAPTLEQFCGLLEKLPHHPPTDQMLVALANQLTQAEVRGMVGELMEAWRLNGLSITPQELAWSLRAASRMDEAHRARQSLELVWTGPTPESSTLRRTDQALLELIESARAELIMTTFAAYKVPAICGALMAAIERGVQVVLILESAKVSEGKVTFDPKEAFPKHLLQRVEIYAWPLDKRDVDAQGRHGSLHAKCAVADQAMAFISSANLTEYALSLNMELGMLAKGGSLPRELAAHLRGLIQSRVLMQCAAS